MVAGKSFNGKFTVKIWFSDRAFYVTIADADIASLKCLSMHYLVSIWTTYRLNLNKIVWSEIYKILSFLTKNGYHLLQSVDAILENVSVTETIV